MAEADYSRHLLHEDALESGLQPAADDATISNQSPLSNGHSLTHDDSNYGLHQPLVCVGVPVTGTPSATNYTISPHWPTPFLLAINKLSLGGVGCVSCAALLCLIAFDVVFANYCDVESYEQLPAVFVMELLATPFVLFLPISFTLLSQQGLLQPASAQDCDTAAHISRLRKLKLRTILALLLAIISPMAPPWLMIFLPYAQFEDNQAAAVFWTVVIFTGTWLISFVFIYGWYIAVIVVTSMQLHQCDRYLTALLAAAAGTPLDAATAVSNGGSM